MQSFPCPNHHGSCEPRWSWIRTLIAEFPTWTQLWQSHHKIPHLHAQALGHIYSLWHWNGWDLCGRRGAEQEQLLLCRRQCKLRDSFWRTNTLIECIFSCLSSKNLQEIFYPRSCYHPVCEWCSTRMQYTWFWEETTHSDTAGRWDSWQTGRATELEVWLHVPPTWKKIMIKSNEFLKWFDMTRKKVLCGQSLCYTDENSISTHKGLLSCHYVCARPKSCSYVYSKSCEFYRKLSQ